jgi:pyruvate/2-oxoglutarate dehydrogenase complex dihydrolipoamide dehydrogenase (E3) component
MISVISHLIILGGGPAGVTAALRARELGAKVTLIESKRIGGTIINSGPAPVRTLARAARLIRDSKSWHTFGLVGEPPHVNLAAVLANADRVANYAYEKKHLTEHLRAAGIEVIESAGVATFQDPHMVRCADGRTWEADRYIIAVGGHGRVLPIPGSEMGLTYQDVRNLKDLPVHVAVIGGASTGCQLASIFEDFGCRVTLIEFTPRLVPQEDEAVSAGLIKGFRDRGMAVIVGGRAERLERTPSGIRLHYQAAGEPASEVMVDAVFFAVGWPGNIENLGVEAAGLATEGSYIVVNDYLQASVPHIYAAGDVNGRSMLVQSAMYEGYIAAENAVLGQHRRFTHEVVPSGSFTDPEYASVGLTERVAGEHYQIAVATVQYDDLLRPVVDAHPEGFCKLIVDRRQRHILGVHVLGEYSVEVIQTAAVCMAAGMRIEQLAELQLAYPTVTEALGMAARRLVRELGVVPMAPSWDDMEPQLSTAFT